MNTLNALVTYKQRGDDQSRPYRFWKVISLFKVMRSGVLQQDLLIASN
jgi:hypothetical protein